MRKNGMWIYAFIMAACADSRLSLAPHGASPPCRAHDLAPARFVGVLFDKGDLEKSLESLLRLRRGTTVTHHITWSFLMGFFSDCGIRASHNDVALTS
jgi:hypothetical protein